MQEMFDSQGMILNVFFTTKKNIFEKTLMAREEWECKKKQTMENKHFDN